MAAALRLFLPPRRDSRHNHAEHCHGVGGSRRSESYFHDGVLRARPLSIGQSSLEARRYIVRGRVQGVGFRWFVEREAHILGIAGWVRNNSDGSVEVLAQGTRDQLGGLRSRLREGPRAARVDAVEESETRTSPSLSSFRIEGAW